MHRILIVDDENSILEFFQMFLTKEGYHVDTAAGVGEAFKKIEHEIYSLVVTDLSMPSGSGIDVLRKTKEVSTDTVVLMMTAYSSTESAIEAMKLGAYDYVMKPFKLDEIRLTIRNALEKLDLKKENQTLKSVYNTETSKGLDRFIGKSAQIKMVCDLISRVSPGRTSILISGESGTGKELAARAIHECSSRSKMPFVAINCAAIPADLLESELFGYLKGSFSGAHANKLGLFETAHGGTLFLDEVGELPIGLQAKLLRVLQERTIRRLGSNLDTVVDVRIISATNRNLELEVENGTFRQDLFFRLNVVGITMPALRDRKEDIEPLIHAFLKKYSREHGNNVSKISEEALAILLTYHYPGNVRELENLIEQAVALEHGEIIQANTLPTRINANYKPETLSTHATLPEEGVNLEKVIDELEKSLLLDALKRTGGVRKKAADLLHISFRSMRYRLLKHHISVDDNLGD